MTILEMIQEVCKRTGEGLEQHQTRAHALLWTALTALIQSGAIKKDEIRLLYNAVRVDYDIYSATPEILEFDIYDAANFKTTIDEYLIFEQEYLLFDKTYQEDPADKIFCSRVEDSQLESAEFLLSLSALHNEVLYAVKYPYIRTVHNSKITASSEVVVELRFYGLAQSVAEDTTAEMSLYFDNGVQLKIIEAAAELLKSEIVA